jgi:hypothetical protein
MARVRWRSEVRTTLELSHVVQSSATGDDALSGLELAVDDLATAYHRSPPADLLERVRAHAGYVARLLDGRVSLAAHRRILVSRGWLSLLAATCLIDLNRDRAAFAHLRTAAQIARETEHAEMAAWVLETRAWHLLTGGEYKQAVALSLAAQRVAPRDSSATIATTRRKPRRMWRPR